MRQLRDSLPSRPLPRPSPNPRLPTIYLNPSKPDTAPPRRARRRNGCYHSYFLDIPHQIRRSLYDPLQVLPIGGIGFPLPGRQIGHDFKGTFLDRGGELLALIERRRLDPLSAQVLQLVVVGPAEPGIAPLALSGRLTTGSSRSAPTQPVAKMLQPPLSIGSFEARRVTSVPQSIACRSTS